MVETESLSFTEQLVLLGLVDAEQEGASPVESIQLKQRTLQVIENCNAEAVGRLSEREVMRALSSLGTKPYLNEHISDTSPTGKGRPQYGLDCHPEEIIDAIGDDERLGDVVEQFW